MDATVVGALIVGLAAGGWFVRRQRVVDEPLLDLSLLRRPGFSPALLTNMAAAMAQVGLLLLIPQYLQLVAGLSPLHAGLWLLPGAVAGIAGSLMAPRLAQYLGVRWPVAAGMALSAVAAVLLILPAFGAGLAVVVAAITAAELAISVALTLTVDVVVAVAPAERAGAASALSETALELGGALGITALGTVAAVTYTAGLPAGAPGETLGETVSLVDDPTLVAAATHAFTSGLAVAAGVAAAILLGGALLAGSRLRREMPDGGGPVGDAPSGGMPSGDVASGSAVMPGRATDGR